ncbi:unnamed protein product [Gordionus sp. m RMFG-2023]
MTNNELDARNNMMEKNERLKEVALMDNKQSGDIDRPTSTNNKDSQCNIDQNISQPSSSSTNTIQQIQPQHIQPQILQPITRDNFYPPISNILTNMAQIQSFAFNHTNDQTTFTNLEDINIAGILLDLHNSNNENLSK